LPAAKLHSEIIMSARAGEQSDSAQQSGPAGDVTGKRKRGKYAARAW